MDTLSALHHLAAVTGLAGIALTVGGITITAGQAIAAIVLARRIRRIGRTRLVLGAALVLAGMASTGTAWGMI